MDSGNNSSGSMQSSSGGEEEYDSRAESSLAAFFNNQPPPPPQTQSHVFPFTTNLPLTSPQQMFDPLSNFLDPTPTLQNPNLVWSKPTRSEPNQTDPAYMNQAIMSNHQLPPVPQTLETTLNCVEMNPPRNSNTTTMARNPKKRSRASRRAPTTVLTTDTTNFRAMVQEFTGIPAPPFTPSSSLPFSRTRFDVFSSSSSSSAIFDPPYLLRPFPQKLAHLNNSNTNLLKQPLTFSTHNNQFVTFQSPKYPSHQQNSLEIPLSSAHNSSHIENLGLSNASTIWAHNNNSVPINGSSSSDFNAEKGPECGGTTVAARNQGTMESWINCSSD